jgi:Protein of unknown function (DUF3995)
MRRFPLAPYAAAAWCFAFAVPSFYWAAGGKVGEETIAADTDEALGWAAEPWALALVGALKVAGGLFALALAARSTPSFAGRLLTVAAWLTGILLVLYGIISLATNALIVAGAIDTPQSLGSAAARWHLIVWDPWWVLGGVLFILAARSRSYVATQAG